MDITISVDWMREAVADGRHADADAHAADIGDWILSGGFVPSGILTSGETVHALRVARERDLIEAL